MHLHAIYRNGIILTKHIWKVRTMSSKSLSVKHNFHFILNTPSSFLLASSVVVPISSYLWTSFVCLPLYFRLIIIFSSSFQLSIHSCVSSLHFQVYDSFTWPVPQFSSSCVPCLSQSSERFLYFCSMGHCVLYSQHLCYLFHLLWGWLVVCHLW